MKKIILLLLISIKYVFKNKPLRRFMFLKILSCSRNIHLLIKTGKLERIRHEIYETKNISQKARQIHPIIPRICSYTTLPYSCKV